MSVELGFIFILFAGVVLKGIIDWLMETVQDELIKQLDDHNGWQDSECARLRERIVKLEKRLQEMEDATNESE